MLPRLLLNHSIFALLTTITLCLAGPVSAQSEELLDAKDAFIISGLATKANTLTVRFDVAEDYYLYRHAFKFTTSDSGVTLGNAAIPVGKKKKDDWFGEVETYRGRVDIDIPFYFSGDSPPSLITVEAVSQGCADLGLCYPPLTQFVGIAPTADSVASEPPPGLAVATSEQTSTNAAVTGGTYEIEQTECADNSSEQGQLAAKLKEGLSVVTLLLFFLLGLGLAFTPCVFPMIPILSGIIAGQGQDITTGKAFRMSLVYVLAMAVTYTAAGIVVGLSGQNVQIMFQDPVVLSIFAAVFVALSLSMFGYYELQMPSSIQSKLSSISNKQQGGTYIGVAIMGFLSALIVGPCITAPLIGALIYIADTGDAVLGGSALFALSIGMGTPLILIGTSSGSIMPKAGSWMDAVKSIFGILLLAIAIWLLSRILPETITMLLYGVLLIGSAVGLAIYEKPQISATSQLWKTVRLLAFIWGTTLIIGAANGNGTLLQPLRGFSGQAEQHVVFQQIKGLDGLSAAQDEAIVNGQPIMFDLYADWCVSCKEMEAFTFTDPEVAKLLENFMLIQADVTKNDEQDQALTASLGVKGPPSIIFYNQDGQEICGQRVVGYKNAKDFAAHLRNTLEKLN